MNTFIQEAKKSHYAIPQINVNGLIWIECILKAAEKTRSPIILGTTDKVIDFLGGYDFICKTIKNKVKSMNITVPVIIHLDHGLTLEGCKKAVDAGYDSVMFDGSKLPIDENIAQTKEIVDYAHKHHVIVEGEVGAIGGNEDGVIGNVQYARLEDCIRLAKEANLDTLAPALGSVHGKYQGEPNLGFKEMEEIQEAIDIPLVLHGASGISDEDLVRAIKLGHAKINFNTEINIAWSNQLRQTLTNDQNIFNPQQILNPSKDAIEETVVQIIHKCLSNNRA
ncbi:class II fructose-1,6-bisphosphate aldolase [Mammaliicoccus vitulinus]|uniref:class II fructose-1,6-bisphosphate aldolase n=1 Tax=Mammaliicoccus vitulinus TaxID=71237 RepID=UPI00145B0CA3|nr:class II fructose-1,6-bisphosphate aldolase [Mammaliicoccus vitulinus]MBM6629598.1 class II fructose-1,6-bisphosphate aldolase [Mammaliicoccus vitulinus]QJF24313.1 class II fructose-1,6-bisphosphate aldolase [Mammaliicoccus vitulinus]